MTPLRCAHCDTLIVDRSTMVETEKFVFCCNNCAAAYARAEGEPTEASSAR